MELGMRHMCREDIDAVVALAQACIDVDDAGGAVTRASIESQFEMPGLDITSVVWVLPAADGRVDALVTAVPLETPDGEVLQLGVQVHPDRRPEGLEERLLGFAEECAAKVRKDATRPTVMRHAIPAHVAERAEMYRRHGYGPVRWFIELRRPLGDAIPEAPLPPGVTIEVVDGTQDIGDVHEVLTCSFRDHWSPIEFTPEQLAHMLGAPAMQPLRVVLARSGVDPAGVCAARIRAAKNRRSGTHEGYILMLGVTRPHRGQGLATALLCDALRWLVSEGMDTAFLDVDAESPTGADRLYARVGFVEHKRTVVYEKPLV